MSRQSLKSRNITLLNLHHSLRLIDVLSLNIVKVVLSLGQVGPTLPTGVPVQESEAVFPLHH